MDIVATNAARHPDKLAIVDEERRLSWREFHEVRNRVARGLLRLDVREGDRVVVYAHNSADHLIAGAAARAIGAVPVPMNHRLAAEEVAYILGDSDAVVAFVSEAFLPVAARVRATARSVRRWVSIGSERPAWAVRLDDLAATGTPEALPEPSSGLGGSMIYTAGTTGRPKGARRRATDPGLVRPWLEALGVADPDHVHLVAGPLYHSAPGGFALYAHMFGNTVVVLRRFDPEGALSTIARQRCTTTFMAPTLVKRIVDLPASIRGRYDVSSLRSIVIAGAPCPMRVKEEALRIFGPVVYEFYGSTELGINTVLGPDDMLRKPGSCGRAAPGVALAILDDSGQAVPTGQPGELFVRRHPGMLEDYWKNPEATRQMARGDWLSVGDIAWLDADGFVHICDRKRDMIISGGVNIYPAEIEDVLHRHPAVLDAAVFGVPDDEWGERVHAAVQPRAGMTVTADDVKTFARAHLAGYKVPRDVTFHADFPRDSAGKLVKRLLREPYWAGRASRV
jgi:acyl-CoA synthetase (AMP-forming)/AMP-acid ligase II